MCACVFVCACECVFCSCSIDRANRRTSSTQHELVAGQRVYNTLWSGVVVSKVARGAFLVGFFSRIPLCV